MKLMIVLFKYKDTKILLKKDTSKYAFH